jgi:hypothetical protein
MPTQCAIVLFAKGEPTAHLPLELGVAHVPACLSQGAKASLACYVVMFEAIVNAKRITPDLVHRVCYGKLIWT